MTTDTVFAIFSTTKAITGTAVLQCVEEAKLDLDAPAKTYAPEIGKLQVIEGFDADGKPMLRAPKRDVTTRMLMLHTAGFGYDFFNETYNRLAQEHGQPSVITALQGVADDAAAVRSGRAVGVRLATSTGAARSSRAITRQAARRGAAGADLRAARHARHRLLADAARCARGSPASTSARPTAR